MRMGAAMRFGSNLYLTPAGIGLMMVTLLLVGAIPVTLLSLGADYLFGTLERRLTPRGLRAA